MNITDVIIIAVAVVIAIVSFVMYNSKSQELQRRASDVEQKIKDSERDIDQKIKDSERDVEQKKKDLERELEQNKKELELKLKEELYELEQKKKELMVQVKDEMYKEKEELEKEIKEKEKRILQKEENLDKKIAKIEVKEQSIKKIESEIEEKTEKAESLLQEQTLELERISKMNINEAKELLLSKIETELKQEHVQKIKDYHEKTKSESEKLARKILSQAIQRCAVDHVVEACVSVVTLPSDDMKGRIIGREGRNIRTFESLTGVELVIDDTPEAVVISGFDPVRREIARIALDYLVSDGRIHPTRIEEVVDKAKSEVEQKIKEAGEKTVFELGIQNIHPEIVRTIGKLQYRTSYGQNILQHSKEVSHLAGIMAAELGVNVKLAKRAGLLHDLGKALTHEEEGTHTALGVELARKYNETPKVLHAMACHHHDIEFETVEAVLVQVADALSAARPGARMEPVENYIKRMEKLEEIANSFQGVEKCFAMQAGREIRVVVQPDAVNDQYADIIAREIAQKIESEMEYPGQVKVTVIRETRATNFAK